MDERTRIDVIDGVTGHTPDMLRFVNEPAVTTGVTASFPVGYTVTLVSPWPAPDPEDRIHVAYRWHHDTWEQYVVLPVQRAYLQDPMHN